MTADRTHPLLLQALRESSVEPLLTLAPDEWVAVVAEAERQGLVPLLHDWITRTGRRERVPAQALDRLKGERIAVAARSLFLATELVAILRAFEASNVRCAPLRGPALAEQLHGDLTLRPMGDLDLLVRKDQLTQLSEVLGSLGFQEVDRRPGFARAYSYTLKLVKDSHLPVVVEPHWTIAYPPFVDAVDMPGVWQRCSRGTAVGVETWRLGREDTFVNLCLHAVHRDDAPLLWFWELDRLVRREPLAWRLIVSRCHAAGIGVLLAAALERTRALFATPVPEEGLAPLAGPASRGSRSRLVRLLADGRDVDGRESLALFLALPGLRARLRYLVALLFPTPAFMRLHYGVRRRDEVARAYVGRLARFSWEALKGLLRLVRRPVQV
ncbi:MAG: nucleotidyltransferase family protein [Candidatus Rokubacteria bacterium]|nr:nucleotidyltransferase family protein [Candidatus Rokubacteria bacterium]